MTYINDSSAQEIANDRWREKFLSGSVRNYRNAIFGSDGGYWSHTGSHAQHVVKIGHILRE